MHKPEDGLARRPKYSIVRETGDGLLSETRPIPRLLYRFFDSGSQGINQASGFMAGLFVHHPLVPSHLIEEAVFEAASIGHLTPEIKPSPFVSFFDSLRPALYRALQSSLDPYISIIDTADLMEAHKRRHGVENGCIFSAEDIIFRYKMKLRRNYYGPSEWLVWGSVPSVAVVTTFSMRQLRDYVYTNAHVEEVVQIRTFDTARCYQEVFRKLEYPAHLSAHQIGNTIRALLLAMRMPEHHLLEAARTVRAKWRLNEADPVAFYRGVLGKRAMIAHEGRVLQEDQPEYHIMEELTERFSTWSNAGSDLARQAEQYTWPSAGIDGEKVQSLRTLKPQRSVAGDIANADLTAFANDMLRYLAEGTPSPAAWAGCCIPPPVRTLLSPSVRSPTPAAIRKSRRKRNFIDLTTKDHDYYTSTSKGYASRLDVDDHDTEDSGFIIVHRNNEEKDSFRRMQGDEDEDLVYLTAPED
ncbi:hypothetical protein UCRPC4_g01990 [Phaeomoniella chlamydospora]|uniref:DUF7587 domain-containing protein n=1 Tax=Phaeomoniella chlamydospora TaxID=158046 RepID=A0A0G2ESI4_PHACM|nr:hypothetical protein UCRPC4_g01990 [Phaeomoniella chlamydospora]